jgi:ABC-type transport system involved in cytochrome c biogenesis permease subunit
MKVSSTFYNERSQPYSPTSLSSENDFRALHTKTNSIKTKFAETLDNLSYRILGIGLPFLTIGILSGAVWANE